MKKFTIPDTASYMMAVPRDKSEIQTPEAVMYRLRATKELNIKNIEIFHIVLICLTAFLKKVLKCSRQKRLPRVTIHRANLN